MSALAEHVQTQIDTDVGGAIEYCYEQGWTDGLPVVPPESARVEAMLALEGRPAETIIASHATTGRECSILSAAVNAVMAGCRPEYFPVVVAALEAMNEHGYHFYASTASTGGAAPLLIVSGPIVEDIGMNARGNVFGPGNRANANHRPRDPPGNPERVRDRSRALGPLHPGPPWQVHLLHRGTRRSQSLARPQRATRLPEGREFGDGVRGSRFLQRREPSR